MAKKGEKSITISGADWKVFMEQISISKMNSTDLFHDMMLCWLENQIEDFNNEIKKEEVKDFWDV